MRAWSPSRLFDYETCPALYKYRAIERRPEPVGGPDHPLVRGLRVHKEIEDYISNGGPLTEEIKPIEALLSTMREGAKQGLVKTELQLALNEKWEPTRWFARDAYVRCKVDALSTMDPEQPHVWDWKTGRYRDGDEKYADQMGLYGLATLASGFGKLKVEPHLCFVDSGGRGPPTESVWRKDLPALVAKWTERVQPLQNDTVFAPRANYTCRWCAFAKSKGGPCSLG